MKHCKQCDEEIPSSIYVEGKRIFLNRRKFCLRCSPFGARNTRRELLLSQDGIPIFEVCPRCKIEKHKSEYYLRREGTNLSPYCIPCQISQITERQRKAKLDYIEYKGGKCSCCNYNRCAGALEFHHVLPEHKDFSLAQSKAKRLGAVKSELDKCILVCANCHREIHAGLIKIIVPAISNRPLDVANQLVEKREQTLKQRHQALQV